MFRFSGISVLSGNLCPGNALSLFVPPSGYVFRNMYLILCSLLPDLPHASLSGVPASGITQHTLARKGGGQAQKDSCGNDATPRRVPFRSVLWIPYRGHLRGVIRMPDAVTYYQFVFK